jgi:hypothetical protein
VFVFHNLDNRTYGSWCENGVSFTMFCYLGVQSMNSPICFKFGEIRKQITPCIARTSLRIGPHTTLKIVVGTLNALKIVPLHLRLHSKKGTSLAPKTCKFWGFKCSSKQKEIYYKGEGEKKYSPRDHGASKRHDHG